MPKQVKKAADKRIVQRQNRIVAARKKKDLRTYDPNKAVALDKRGDQVIYVKDRRGAWQTLPIRHKHVSGSNITIYHPGQRKNITLPLMMKHQRTNKHVPHDLAPDRILNPLESMKYDRMDNQIPESSHANADIDNLRGYTSWLNDYTKRNNGEELPLHHMAPPSRVYSRAYTVTQPESSHPDYSNAPSAFWVNPQLYPPSDDA